MLHVVHVVSSQCSCQLQAACGCCRESCGCSRESYNCIVQGRSCTSQPSHANSKQRSVYQALFLNHDDDGTAKRITFSCQCLRVVEQHTYQPGVVVPSHFTPRCKLAVIWLEVLSTLRMQHDKKYTWQSPYTISRDVGTRRL